MTIQEAIKILKMEMLGDSERMECAKQIAVGALEKQMSKKPLNICTPVVPDGWISVKDRLPDCNGKYLVAYHPAYWDNVNYNEVDVGTDSYRVLKTPGRKSWAHKKYRLVTHWQPLPDQPRMAGEK